VVVESGDSENPTIRMVSGAYDAVPVLVHGLATHHGQAVYERTVNGYAGLLLSRNDERTAAVTVDFAGRLIRSVWIRLSPQR
jgi:RNA polymerase sigma-70 factor (ECF subfamily)